MSKKLILVAAPPACGKNYVSDIICKAVGNIAYLDKDDFYALRNRFFTLCDEKVDVDGEFYSKNVRPFEYETLLDVAFSALRYSQFVLVNAPFLGEVRDEKYMLGLKERANAMQAKLILIWVNTPVQICYDRMKKRNSNRDADKLLHWDEYVKKINYSIPISLEEKNCVDKLIVFENENNESANSSLNKVIKTLGE